MATAGWELVSLEDPGRIEDGLAYRSLLPGRQADLVRCLIAPGDRGSVYDLRIVARPRPPAPNRIRVAVLAHTDHSDTVEDLGALLAAALPEAEFRRLEPEEANAFLTPFTTDQTVRIERRRGVESLGTLRRGAPPVAGFGRPPMPVETDDVAIYHLFPFTPGGTDHGHLLRMLLTRPAATVVSVKIRPTALTDEEEAFLEDGIESCGSYLDALARQGASDRMTTAAQAAALQRIHIRLLEGLSDECCEMVIEVGSTQPVGHALSDAVGALVTGPSGGVDRDPAYPIDGYLMGGYEVVATASALGDGNLPEVEGAGPERRLHRLFDSVEAARAFRLPDALVPEPTGIPRTSWTVPLPPAELPAEGTLVAKVGEREWRIAPEDRLRHAYIVGQTGTGKTTLLQTMILDDIEAGHGVCVIDPHGDLYRWLVERIPKDRWDDVVLVDPTDTEHPVGFNPLEHRGPQERHHLVQEMVGMIRRMVLATYSVDTIGPVFFQHVRMNLLLVMSSSERQGTLLDFYNVFQRRSPADDWPLSADADPLLVEWVTGVLSRTDYTRTSDDALSMGGYISSKFQPFVFDPLLRNILGQRHSTFDLRQCMDEQKVVLVNLAKGALAEDNAYWFGMLLLSKLMVEAMGRIDLPPERRAPFHLYVDEFQSMASENFVSMLSEGRKFGLAVVMANQFVSQLDNPVIPAGIFGNVGTIVSFRTGVEDAALLTRQFGFEVTPTDFTSLPNWKAYAYGLMGGTKLGPFLIDTVPPRTTRVPGAARSVRDRSRRRYATARKEAEADLNASIQLRLGGI